tara:strand:+ start:236 stop:364 length:129 start_codon:yes stop_codon:yes gene_type:complete
MTNGLHHPDQNDPKPKTKPAMQATKPAASEKGNDKTPTAKKQ